jgi:hypothetical protein
MNEFKIGDRVKGEYGDGTIIGSANGLWLVRYYNPKTELHNGNGLVATKYTDKKCWFESNLTINKLKTKPTKKVREVSRPAKVGEWIKCVSTGAKRREDHYELGEVYKVTGLGGFISSFVYTSHGQLAPKEYVVLEGYTPKDEKHKWTKEEVLKAQKMSLDIISSLFFKGISPVFYVYDNGLVEARFSFGSRGKDCMIEETKAKPSKNDESNEWIGKLVCLCKATKREIPSWIRGEQDADK